VPGTAANCTSPRCVGASVLGLSCHSRYLPGHGSAGIVDLVVLSECVYGESAGGASYSSSSFQERRAPRSRCIHVCILCARSLAGEGCMALLDTVTALCTSTDTRVMLSYTLRPVLRCKSNPSDYLCPVSFDEVTSPHRPAVGTV
jgi:hypothetical protein